MNPLRQLNGNQINWNQVFYFSEVAASGSLKDAAAKLGVTPSTLSEHITQLESDLEVQLFFRQHRKLTLTPEGNRLFLRAKVMFEAGQRLIDLVSPVPFGCYPISVGLVPNPSLPQAYQILGQYTRQFGPIGMKLIHSKHSALETGLTKSEFDLGFTDQKPDRRDLVHHEISATSIRFYVSAKHHRESSFADLIATLPLLVCTSEPSVRNLAEQALIDAETPPTAVISSDYPGSLLELCEQGLGIGAFSEATLTGRDESKFRQVPMPKEIPRLGGHLYAVWARDAESTEAIRHLRQILGI